jgi:hypothetical protein
MDKQDKVILREQSISRSTHDYIGALRTGMLKLTHNAGFTAVSNVHSWCASVTVHSTLTQQL